MHNYSISHKKFFFSFNNFISFFFITVTPNPFTWSVAFFCYFINLPLVSFFIIIFVVFFFTFITLNPHPRSVAFILICHLVIYIIYNYNIFFTLVQKWPSVQNCHLCKIFTRETHAILTRSYFYYLFLIWSVVYIVCSIYINCISKQKDFFFQKDKSSFVLIG